MSSQLNDQQLEWASMFTGTSNLAAGFPVADPEYPEQPDAPPDVPPAPGPGPAPSAGGTPTLRKGDKGKAVQDCQTLLNKHGASLTVDGDFGDLTLAAVKDFQKNNPPLKDDGIVGAQTWAALSASKPAPTQDHMLLVTVKDSDGNAVMNATVVIDDDAPATTGEGSNSLSIRVKPGEHICRVMQSGFKEYQESVTVGDAPTTPLEVTLKSESPVPPTPENGVSFGVQVLSPDPKGGNPIPLASATFQIGGKSLPTDQSGFARIELPPGSYPYQVTAKKHQSHEGLMKSGNEKQVMNTVLLERGAMLLINTKSSDGKPAMDVTIQIDDESPDTTGAGSSKLFINSVSPGKHTYQATAEGFRKTNGDFQMGEADTPLDVVLEPSQPPDPAIPTGKLSLKVVWAGTKEPVKNAMATVEPPPLPPSATMELAGENGLANFETLAVGKCTITVEMFESKATQEVTISEGSIELAEIELPRPASGKLTVKVVWAGGNQGVANATVSIDPPPVPPAALFELADDKGIANFDDVIVGKCTVTAKSKGSVGKVNVNISEDTIELATIALPVPVTPPGKLLVKVTNNGQIVVGQKITVNSDDRRPEQLKQEAATKDDGVAPFTLPAGNYIVTSRIAPFAISTSVEAGKTKEITFEGKSPPDVVVDVVPWNTYFNEQFPICENEWFILNIGRTVPIFPGPGGTATNYILECMSRNVTARVEAEDKLASRSPQAGRTRTELNDWFQKNKGKFAGLDETP